MTLSMAGLPYPRFRIACQGRDVTSWRGEARTAAHRFHGFPDELEECLSAGGRVRPELRPTDFTDSPTSSRSISRPAGGVSVESPGANLCNLWAGANLCNLWVSSLPPIGVSGIARRQITQI